MRHKSSQSIRWLRPSTQYVFCCQPDTLLKDVSSDVLVVLSCSVAFSSLAVCQCQELRVVINVIPFVTYLPRCDHDGTVIIYSLIRIYIFTHPTPLQHVHILVSSPLPFCSTHYSQKSTAFAVKFPPAHRRVRVHQKASKRPGMTLSSTCERWHIY